MMMMLMGWAYVSELQPPTGLFFIAQVIYVHEEPWWMMLKGENGFIHQSALRQSYPHSHLVSNQEDLGEGNDGFGL
jgi:hypothetical protein